MKRIKLRHDALVLVEIARALNVANAGIRIEVREYLTYSVSLAGGDECQASYRA